MYARREHHKLYMIALETIANAQVHVALGADDASLSALERTVRADCAVPSLLCVLRIVVLHQRDGSIGPSACLHRLAIGSEQLHQGLHELFSEIELSWSILADRPQLEGIDDAHIEQPPC